MPSCNVSLKLSGRDSLLYLHKNTFPLQYTKDSQGHYSLLFLNRRFNRLLSLYAFSNSDAARSMQMTVQRTRHLSSCKMKPYAKESNRERIYKKKISYVHWQITCSAPIVRLLHCLNIALHQNICCNDISSDKRTPYEKNSNYNPVPNYV